MVWQTLYTSDNDIVYFLLLRLIFFNHTAVTDWDTELIFVEFDTGDNLVFFGVIKGNLTLPLFFALFLNNIITLSNGNKVLEQHEFLATEL